MSVSVPASSIVKHFEPLSDPRHTRERFAASNLSWLRRLAISLLKRHPSKHSIKGKSEMAGWNNEFLMQVLLEQGT